jgi:8-oxo-dGTP pyrophosphatase MutT (NUDIX family)
VSEARAPDALRDAAAIVLIRRDGPVPRVLMGQRGRGAVFMPSKFVFPGGAVDPEDAAAGSAAALDPAVRRMLGVEADPALAVPLAMAAIRELWEETGLRLGRPAGQGSGAPPPGWSAFCGDGLVPAPEHLDFLFRATTPPGWPRRFDARFFLAESDAVAGDPDDFSAASDELSHLRWLSLDEARGLDLPDITRALLAALEPRARAAAGRGPAPFYRDDVFYRMIDR